MTTQSPPVPIPRIDVGINDFIGNVPDFGSIRIIHNGSPKQVSAKLSQYDITSTTPFNLHSLVMRFLKEETDFKSRTEFYF